MTLQTTWRANGNIISPSQYRNATLKYPDFNWDGYNRSLNKVKKGLGTMEETAMVNQGNALVQTAWKDIDEVKRHVVAAYGNGNSKLTSNQIAAVVALAWSMQLDPSPGVGHIYAWDQKGKLMLTIGYQGYLYKAEQQHEIYYEPARAMTQEEREQHGLKDGEFGSVCELYSMARARRAKELGLQPKPIMGIAVWRPEENKDYDGNFKIPKGRTPQWVANKNALKDALRQLGLGFGSMAIPAVNGFAYDWQEDAFVEIDPEKTIEGSLVSEVTPPAVTVEPKPDPVTEATEPVKPAITPAGKIRTLPELKASLLTEAGKLAHVKTTPQELAVFKSRFITKAALGEKPLSTEDAKRCLALLAFHVFEADIEALTGGNLRAGMNWLSNKTSNLVAAAEIEGAWAALQTASV